MSAWFAQLVESFGKLNALTWIVLACVAGVGVLLMVLSRQRWTTLLISRGALAIALSFILSCLVIYRMPQGGSITPASMLPVLMFAWIFGAGPGIAVGAAYGLLQLVQDPTIIHPLQLLLDYIFPFALLGVAGFMKKNIFLAVGVSAVLRFLCHFVSGFVFWGAYADPGQSPVLYSLIYNGSYMLPETLVCLAVVAIPAARALLKRTRAQWTANKIKS